MSWLMTQTWNKLLFAHWPVQPLEIAPLLPKGLELDTYDGAAWIGVVPFTMTAIRMRGLPAIPFTTSFAELNVRTYVKGGEKPGVYFFSLDAAHRPAVWAARTFFHLPYYNARIRSELIERQSIRYESIRVDARDEPAAFQAEYRPVSGIYHAEKNSHEYWLTERYCFYTADKNGKLLRGDIRHEPWPLQKAEADIHLNTMVKAAHIGLPDCSPLLHYSHRLKVHLRRLVAAET